MFGILQVRSDGSMNYGGSGRDGRKRVGSKNKTMSVISYLRKLEIMRAKKRLNLRSYIWPMASCIFLEVVQ